MKSKPSLILVGALLLSACGQIGFNGQVVAPTPLATSTPPPVLVVTATPEPTATAQPRPAPMLAYVQSGVLYLRLADFSSDAIPVDRCEPGVACVLLHLQWSPDGQQLLYIQSALTGESKHFLKMVDRTGAVRLVSDQTASVFAPAWSPDGQHLAYVVDTAEFVDNEEQFALHVVAAASLTDEVVGTIGFGSGCGGGPGSTSQQLLQAEGFGYFSAKLAWAAGDILLYSRMCSGSGLGRFDLQSRQHLEPYSDLAQLHNFTLNADRTRWAAVSLSEGGEKTEIALGNPAQVMYDRFASADGLPVHSVFFGLQSNRLYYTTRLATLSEYFDTTAYQTTDSPFISGQFDFYTTTLWAGMPGAEAHQLGTFDLFGIGSLTEDENGAALFTQIPNDRLLYEAIKANQPLAEALAARPRPAIMRLVSGETLETLIENAGELALTPP